MRLSKSFQMASFGSSHTTMDGTVVYTKEGAYDLATHEVVDYDIQSPLHAGSLCIVDVVVAAVVGWEEVVGT